MRSAWLALVLALGPGCKPACTSTLVRTNEPPGDFASVAELYRIEDEAVLPPPRSGCGSSGERVEQRVGKLGPFGVRYEPYDYRGQPVTTNAPMFLYDPACPSGSTFRFAMKRPSEVALRHDTKRDLWVVSNGTDPSEVLVLHR